MGHCGLCRYRNTLRFGQKHHVRSPCSSMMTLSSDELRCPSPARSASTLRRVQPFKTPYAVTRANNGVRFRKVVPSSRS
jgi:hypothetical protein